MFDSTTFRLEYSFEECYGLKRRRELSKIYFPCIYLQFQEEAISHYGQTIKSVDRVYGDSRRAKHGFRTISFHLDPSYCYIHSLIQVLLPIRPLAIGQVNSTFITRYRLYKGSSQLFTTVKCINSTPNKKL